MGADDKDYNQYISASHLLQYITTSLLKGFTEGQIMQSLGILQIDGHLSSEEPPVPRLIKKKKNGKTRTTSGVKSGRDLVKHWMVDNRGELFLKRGVYIPEVGVHIVRTIPSILDTLLDDEKPSLIKLCRWTNQFYIQTNFDIRQ